VAENPFGDEDTVRRDSNPAEAMEPVDERNWEDTVSRDVLVGNKLGDFVVKRRIGAGGMGIVYEGEHPIIGRKVAIKILRPEFSVGGGARDLLAEARAASAIRHRGIIDVFSFGTIPYIGQYLVMEYLEGAPLDELIAQRAPLLEAEVISLLELDDDRELGAAEDLRGDGQGIDQLAALEQSQHLLTALRGLTHPGEHREGAHDLGPGGQPSGSGDAGAREDDEVPTGVGLAQFLQRVLLTGCRP
jgi:hypothetical protein